MARVLQQAVINESSKGFTTTDTRLELVQLTSTALMASMHEKAGSILTNNKKSTKKVTWGMVA